MALQILHDNYQVSSVPGSGRVGVHSVDSLRRPPSEFPQSAAQVAVVEEVVGAGVAHDAQSRLQESRVPHQPGEVQ